MDGNNAKRSGPRAPHEMLAIGVGVKPAVELNNSGSWSRYSGYHTVTYMIFLFMAYTHLLNKHTIKQSFVSKNLKRETKQLIHMYICKWYSN